MEKVGVFLSRFQPLHNAHLHMIRLALAENDKVVIIIGSSNKKGTERNPFNLRWREGWLRYQFTEEEKKRIIIMPLPDWSMETETSQATRWGCYLYYNVVSRIVQRSFTMYCGEEDKAIIEQWFDDEVLKANITLRTVPRSDVFEGLSATKIRKAILDGDMEYLKKYLPEDVFEDYEYLLKYVTQSIAQKDYSMK